MTEVTLPLRTADFTGAEHVLAEAGGLRVSVFAWPSGVEALRIANARGEITVLPFLGQMVWDAAFDGRRLTMGNSFPQPRPGASILETYGAFLYHAGLLRNGTPSAADSHALHGEFPVARMDRARLVIGTDAAGPFVEVQSELEHVMGFGPHYIARPRIRLHAESALLDVEMEVRNLSAHPMELMYMLHANFDFVAGAEIHQPAPWTPQATRVRKSVPGHVVPSPEFLALLEDLAQDPARMRKLSEPQLYSPEQVFYVTGLGTDDAGRTRLVAALPEGDGFSIAYRPRDLPHCVRWVLNDGDAQVGAFALPSTCEPEGYLAEKAKGHVRMVAPGEVLRFPAMLGHLSADELPAALDDVAALAKN